MEMTEHDKYAEPGKIATTENRNPPRLRNPGESVGAYRAAMGWPLTTEQAREAAAAANQDQWINGVGRDSEHSRCLVVYFNREPSDDDLRRLHDAARAEFTKPALVYGPFDDATQKEYRVCADCPMPLGRGCDKKCASSAAASGVPGLVPADPRAGHRERCEHGLRWETRCSRCVRGGKAPVEDADDVGVKENGNG